jgi:hypothetical protein
MMSAVDVSAGRTPKEDLVVGGLADWADASWASMSARLTGETDPAVLRDLTLSLIAEVLRDGLMVAGDIIVDEHVPWHGSTEEVVERISHEWIEEWGGTMPTPGAIVWLSNTAAGDELARGVLEREANG